MYIAAAAMVIWLAAAMTEDVAMLLTVLGIPAALVSAEAVCLIALGFIIVFVLVVQTLFLDAGNKLRTWNDQLNTPGNFPGQQWPTVPGAIKAVPARHGIPQNWQIR